MRSFLPYASSYGQWVGAAGDSGSIKANQGESNQIEKSSVPGGEGRVQAASAGKSEWVRVRQAKIQWDSRVRPSEKESLRYVWREFWQISPNGGQKTGTPYHHLM
jgi:hypothetical protein